MTSQTADIHPELGDEAFLHYLFLSLLGRVIDPEALLAYRGHLRNGQTRMQLAVAIADSEEAARYAEQAPCTRPVRSVQDLLALDGTIFLRQAYQQVLGRDPDPDGVRGYAPRIVSGEAKEQIVTELHSGEEGQSWNSQLPGLIDLTRVVRELNGEPEAKATPASLEFLLQFDNDQFVRMAFRALLRRTVDVEGLLRYRGLIAQGYSKLYILDALYRSQEAREKKIVLAPLDQRLAGYRRAQRTDWKGWFWRQVRGVESDLPRDREMRALLTRLNQR